MGVWRWVWLGGGALVVLALALVAGALAGNRVPLLEPPGPAERLRIYLSRNGVETGANSLFPELETPRYPFPPDRVLEVVPMAMLDLGWEVRELDRDAARVRAVVTTPILRFRDDVEVRVLPDEAGRGSRMHIRSRSRVGRADFGANLRHVLDLRAALAARLGAAGSE